MTEAASSSVGGLIRMWRERRRLSQLDLALEAEISQRHLSFVESGRSRPSRVMLLRLAEELDVPLRERNAVLLAGGFAPAFAEHDLLDPAMAAAREAIESVLKAHEPFPALAVDRLWTLSMANAALAPLLAGIEDAALLAPPVNVLRLSLHPGGLAPRIANLAEWRAHILDRLRRQVAVTADAGLAALMAELASYPTATGLGSVGPAQPAGSPDVYVPLKLMTDVGLLSFLSTTMAFGTPRDVTLAEIAVEAFFPADTETAERMRRLMGERDEAR